MTFDSDMLCFNVPMKGHIPYFPPVHEIKICYNILLCCKPVGCPTLDDLKKRLKKDFLGMIWRQKDSASQKHFGFDFAGSGL